MRRRKQSKSTRHRPSAHHHPSNYLVPIVERTKHSVVSVRIKDRYYPMSRRLGFPDVPFSYLPDRDDTFPEHSHSLGSGFVIHPNGYILTSEHVVRDADEVAVKFYNSREYKAEPVWADESKDLCVLKVATKKRLIPLPIGSSSKSKVGEFVISVGNPLGLDHTITTGIISAKNRKIISSNNRVYEDIIQTDCAINPGNSGGPLINMRGEVVGLNAFIAKNNPGLSFAIGIDSIRKAAGRFFVS